MTFRTIYLGLIHSFSGFVKTVRVLIEKGADVNAVNDDHDSALILAVKNGKQNQKHVYVFIAIKSAYIRFDDTKR